MYPHHIRLNTVVSVAEYLTYIHTQMSISVNVIEVLGFVHDVYPAVTKGIRVDDQYAVKTDEETKNTVFAVHSNNVIRKAPRTIILNSKTKIPVGRIEAKIELYKGKLPVIWYKPESSEIEKKETQSNEGLPSSEHKNKKVEINVVKVLGHLHEVFPFMYKGAVGVSYQYVVETDEVSKKRAVEIHPKNSVSKSIVPTAIINSNVEIPTGMIIVKVKMYKDIPTLWYPHFATPEEKALKMTKIDKEIECLKKELQRLEKKKAKLKSTVVSATPSEETIKKENMSS